MVSALASRIRDREFESHDNHFPQNQIIIFLLSLSFRFIFLNFEVKQCANIYWKYDNTGFAMEKKPIFFNFSKWQIPHIRAKQDRLRDYQAFYSRHNLFIEMKMTLHLMTILYKRKKERFVVLATFWKNDNSSWFWYTNSFNRKSSFVLIYYKSEDGYPNFFIFLSSFHSIVH